ncbi:MAG: hypothetical protein O7I42_17865 [Alphaproteobacteria bacterium]|nr:hypothetical protein [Alphaproteobacteria bacterium]
MTKSPSHDPNSAANLIAATVHEILRLLPGLFGRYLVRIRVSRFSILRQIGITV